MKERCDKCHLLVIVRVKLTSEGEPYCPRCGHVFGTSVAPASWVCEDCGEIILHTVPGEVRPWCISCKTPLSCLSAKPSRISGVGTGDADLEYGFEFLCEAQEMLKLDVRPILEKHKADLDLGSDILRDCQND